jgi:hypothetical protein
MIPMEWNGKRKINVIGKSTKGASGRTLIPEGAYMIPMEWNGKRIMQQAQVYRNRAQPTIMGIEGTHNLGITDLKETKESMFQDEILRSKFSEADLRIPVRTTCPK